MLTGARVPSPSARGDYRSHRNMVASDLVYREGSTRTSKIEAVNLRILLHEDKFISCIGSAIREEVKQQGNQQDKSLIYSLIQSVIDYKLSDKVNLYNKKEFVMRVLFKWIL